MKKPVFPRIMLFLLLYFGVFVALVFIQFSKQGSFTQRVGSFVISGQQRLSGGAEGQNPNEFLLEGDTHVFFGGIDFGMISDSDGPSLMLTRKDGAREEALPDRVTVSGESAVFTFPDGTQLEFASQYSGGALLLLITGDFSEDASGVELPFKLQRKAGIKDSEDGNFIVVSGGVSYTFDRSPMDAEEMVLFIRDGGPPISYGAIPERKGFSPEEFILPQAMT